MSSPYPMLSLGNSWYLAVRRLAPWQALQGKDCPKLTLLSQKWCFWAKYPTFGDFNQKYSYLSCQNIKKTVGSNYFYGWNHFWTHNTVIRCRFWRTHTFFRDTLYLFFASFFSVKSIAVAINFTNRKNKGRKRYLSLSGIAQICWLYLQAHVHRRPGVHTFIWRPVPLPAYLRFVIFSLREKQIMFSFICSFINLENCPFSTARFTLL